jgi:chemotaxis protein MotB
LLDRLANTLQKTVDEKGSIKADHTAGSRYSAAPEPGLGDPFDPQSWKTEADNDVMPSHSTRSSDVKSIHKSDRNEVNMSGEQIPRSDRALGQLEGIKRQSASEQDKVDTSFDTDKQQSIKPLPVKHSEVDDLLKDIARELGTAPTDLSRWLEITQSPDGLLISLTESADFEMFKTGSAEPEPDMLRLVTAVAKAINSRPGKIFIRGHTDSRPFRNKYFDNWQLSTARAHIARHMLIRAGLDDERISRIEGVADREPRTPSDPFAPENRRIELLISRN